MHLTPKFIIKIHFNEENKIVDIKLETLRYHLVIFWRDFFTIDFTVKVGHL